MEKLRKIEYYTSDKYDPQAGFMDGGDDDDNKTAIGLFHRFADSYHIDNGRYYPLTEAIIEDEKTGEISYIECNRIIRFVNEWEYLNWFSLIGQTCAKGLIYRPSAQVCPFYFTCISHKFFVYLHHNQRFNNNINFS